MFSRCLQIVEEEEVLLKFVQAVQRSSLQQPKALPPGWNMNKKPGAASVQAYQMKGPAYGLGAKVVGGKR